MKHPPGKAPPALQWEGKHTGERTYVITGWRGRTVAQYWQCACTILGTPGSWYFTQQLKLAICQIETAWILEIGRRALRPYELP